MGGGVAMKNTEEEKHLGNKNTENTPNNTDHRIQNTELRLLNSEYKEQNTSYMIHTRQYRNTIDNSLYTAGVEDTGQIILNAELIIQ